METERQHNGRSVKRGTQGIRTPLKVIRRRPGCVKYALMICLDIDKPKADAYRFTFGWTDPRTGNIIILAHNGETDIPVMLECEFWTSYKTLVTVYEATHETTHIP